MKLMAILETTPFSISDLLTDPQAATSFLNEMDISASSYLLLI